MTEPLHLFVKNGCYFTGMMKRNTIKTLSLVVIICCLYSVYKVPSIYWSLKVRLSLEKNQNGREDISSQHNEILPHKHVDFNQKNLIEAISVYEKRKARKHKGIVTAKGDTESKERKADSILDVSVEDGQQSVMNGTASKPAQRQHDIDIEESVNNSEKNKTNEKDTSADIQNDQFEEVLREITENAPSHYNYKINNEETFDGQFVYEKEDVEFDINDVNDYKKVSENLFKTFPNYQNATKYLIYYCNEKCGGLGDRLKGISTVYMMSILTERRFAISMTTPCELERFLEPNLLDWKYPSKREIIGKTLQTIDCFERHDAYEIDFLKYDPDPKTMMKADVVQMRANQDWTRIFRKMSVTPKRFPQLYQYHSSELLRTIFNGLFKLSPELNDLVFDFFTENVNGKKLACLHARMGEEVYQRYTYREILIPLQFLKEFDSFGNYKIMVATDTEKVKTIATHMFKNFVDTSGPILHIDYMVNGTMTKDRKCAGFMRSVLDHAILQRCDQLVLTGSGFGVTAASIRHTSRGLYVYMKREDVMPTRRELVRETFQWRCLSASWNMDFYRNICDG